MAAFCTAGIQGNLWDHNRTLAGERRKARGTNWKHCQSNASQRHGRFYGRERKYPTQSQLTVSIWVVAPHPLLLVLLPGSLSQLQAVPCKPPPTSLCHSYPGQQDFKPGFFSWDHSMNGMESMKQSSEVKPLKARGRLQCGTVKDFGLFHCIAPLSCCRVRVFPQPWQQCK